MSDNNKKFKKIVQNMIGLGETNEPISDIKISEAVESLFAVSSSMGIIVTEEEKNSVRNELLAENRIRLEPGVA